MKSKKAFTIVELVIVIAVVAILSSVLIPTFSNVIIKAKLSKEIQEVRNIYMEYKIDNYINNDNNYIIKNNEHYYVVINNNLITTPISDTNEIINDNLSISCIITNNPIIVFNKNNIIIYETILEDNILSTVENIIEEEYELLDDIDSPIILPKSIGSSPFLYNNNITHIYFDDSRCEFYDEAINDIDKFNTDKIKKYVEEYEVDNTTYYKLYILSEYKMYANSDCSNYFKGLSKLKEIHFNNFDTSKVTSMSNMFYDLESLETITGIDKFVTTNVTTMESMFYKCIKINNIDISNFDTNNCSDFSNMFRYTTNLSNFIIPSNFIKKEDAIVTSMLTDNPKYQLSDKKIVNKQLFNNIIY